MCSATEHFERLKMKVFIATAAILATLVFPATAQADTQGHSGKGQPHSTSQSSPGRPPVPAGWQHLIDEMQTFWRSLGGH
jgi:hypothetical protein